VLKFERRAGCRTQFEDTVTPERGRPTHLGPIRTGDCEPLRLEADEDAAATACDDRYCDFRDGDTHRTEAPVLARSSRPGYLGLAVPSPGSAHAAFPVRMPIVIGNPDPSALLHWYDRHRRVLPWRAPADSRPDPYRV